MDVPQLIYLAMGDDTDLPEVQFSNEEYYCKLAQLKKAHHRTMAELEHMLRRNLQLRGVATPELLQWGGSSLVLPGTLKKTPSALELRRDSTFSDTDEECESDWKHGDYGNYSMKKGLLNSAKKHIKNMWRDFSMDTISPQQQHPSSASLLSHRDNHRVTMRPKVEVRGQQSKKQQQVKGRCRQVTVPKPFHMTLREAECKRKGVKSRSEIEWENGKLRQQLEELAECQRKFHAGPVPAHVYLPLFKELQEQREERRQLHHLQATEDQRLRATQRPFSFLERERARAEQKEARLLEQAEEERRRRRPFQAKPVPRAVREAAWGERQKEEELYRAIRMQMRAREMLRRSSLPPSAQAARPGGRRGQETEGQADIAGRRLRAGGKVPDFDGSYRRFQRQLVRRREVRPVTVCEPFRLCTANITSRRQRIAADVEADGRNPRQSRWPFVTPAAPAPRTPVCSSQDYLPAKITDSAKKRHEAVRKVLEQRKKVEEEEERWREKQKKKDRRLRKVIWKRAKAYDPHTTLAQTHQHKLREFRKQILHRHREYQEEMREMKQRVKRRPLLLEQVAQMNAKQVALRRYVEALQRCGLSEAFIGTMASNSRNQQPESIPGSPSDSHSTRTLRKHQCADSPLSAVSPEYSLPRDHPADHDDYQQDITGKATADEEMGEHTEGNEYEGSASNQEGEDDTCEDELDFDCVDDS